MNYDVVIVGGGIAGLTSAAFLSKKGYKVLLCEKEKSPGGLIKSFNYKGFIFDGGLRAIENSGIVLPMLKQLEIDIEFVKSTVSIGLKHDVVKVTDKDSLADYQELLSRHFPDNASDIEKIIAEIKKIMKYMDILYGIDNPLFLDFKKDKEYLYKTILPWMFKYMLTVRKVLKLNMPVNKYLEKFSANQMLIDMIAQHFFKQTPTFFALSYFSLYLDYRYPKGGTGTITDKIVNLVTSNGGEIKTLTEISRVDPQSKTAMDTKGDTFGYKKLIWAADSKRLYDSLDLSSFVDEKAKYKILKQKAAISGKSGGDSVLTTYVTLDIDKSFFEKICTPHLFYTPDTEGLSKYPPGSLETRQSILDWLKNLYEHTTYEISCPVMRDDSLAPEGKTGLIISVLMDYSLVKRISDDGWYDEYKDFSQESIMTVLDRTIFPGIKSKVINQFTSTPLSIQRTTGNTDGAITGWAFTNTFIPATNSMPKIAQSVNTPIPDVFQAGQWTFSPSGFPISVLTGKLAADKVNKKLK